MTAATSFVVPPTLLGKLDRIQRISTLSGAVALAICAIGAIFNPAQFFRSYLLGYLFIFGIALGCLAIVMIQHLTGGAWGLVIRRVLEAATRTIPFVALLFVPLIFGLTHLYPWADPHQAADPVLQHKRAYLNVPFFLTRAVLYFLAWSGVAQLLNRWSRLQDQPETTPPERSFRLVSAPGLLLYGLTVTFMSVDWVMSLSASWYSTIFGVLFMGGQALSALTFSIIVLVLLSEAEPLAAVVTPAHFHDLGNLLLGFVMLWAYFSFSQFLIIWSGNLPEETSWYLARAQGGWQALATLLLLGHFAFPFLLLLSRQFKRNRHVLARIAAGVLVMRFIDLFWQIAPAFSAGRFRVHWMDLAAPLGLAGVWLAYFVWQLKTWPLLPAGDPYLRDVLEAEHRAVEA